MRESECGYSGGDAIRRNWLAALDATDYSVACLGDSTPEQEMGKLIFDNGTWANHTFLNDGSGVLATASSDWISNGDDQNIVFLPPGAFDGKGGEGYNPKNNRAECLPQSIAHETLHRVDNDTSAAAYIAPPGHNCRATQ
jgi:hypothetical protein